MDDIRIVELRQYTLRPGRRDELIELFDREFVQPQEAEGMAILGQFRDLDDPDRFVWLRGFTDMRRRAQSLHRFYSGPVWKAHAAQANATMIDSDDVLLLRPARSGSGFPVPAPRPAGPAVEPASVVEVTICHRDRPVDAEFLELFDDRLRPALAGAGADPLAWFGTEYAENTFPALPVRTGEHVFVWFSRFPTAGHLTEHRRRRAQPGGGADLSTVLTEPPRRLRLAPTGRSRLR